MAINNELFSDNAVSHIYCHCYYIIIIIIIIIIINHIYVGHSQLYTWSKYVSNVYVVAAVMWLQFVLHVMLFPLPSTLYT